MSLLALALASNILIVLTDDQDVGTMPVMASVQQLWGGQGVTFTNAYSSGALCAPGRATLLTGQYPHNHGVWSNSGAYGALDYRTTLPVWLQAAGYKTAYMGKFINDYGKVNAPGQSGPPCDEVPAGWDTWFGFLWLANANHYNHYLVNANGHVTKYGNAAVPPGCVVDSAQTNLYSTDKLAQKAAAWIGAHTAGPWFLVVATYAPHAAGGPPIAAPRHSGLFAGDPFPIPGSLNYNEADVSDKPVLMQSYPMLSQADTQLRATFHRKRREALLAVDELVATLEAAVQASGQGSRTVRVFTSDNGWLNGEHRIPGLKTFVYEESAKVPLIVRGPGYQAGMASDALVSHADLAPTFVALTGATAGRTMDGVDLGPLLRGEPVQWRTALLMESRQTSEYDALHTSSYVYVEHLTGETELYDMPNDQGQMSSVHADANYAGVKAALALQLQAMRSCVGGGCWQ